MAELYIRGQDGRPRLVGETADPQLPGRVTALEQRVDAIEAAPGGVPLSDAVDSASSTTAATSKAVKTAFDMAAAVATKERPGNVRPGAALSVDASGILSISPADATGDELDGIRRGLGILIPLTANKEFHVNGETGSDTIDAGRGESADRPFRTLQACLDHVCGNYAVGKYIVDIRLHNGTYPGPFTLGAFARTTGGIRLSCYSADYAATLTSRNAYLFTAWGGVWTLSGLNIDVQADENSGLAVPSTMGIIAASDCNVYLDGCSFNAAYSGDAPAKARLMRLFVANKNGLINFSSTARAKNSITFSKGNATELSVLSASFGGQINLAASGTSQAECTITAAGDCSVFAAAGGGIITRPAALNFYAVVQGDVTGQRYAATHGGAISVAGAGPEFYPGTKAGTVDATTGCWYK